VEPVAQPGRGRADLLALFGAGGAAAGDGGQLLEPVAFEAVEQLSQLQDLGGQGGISQAVQVLGGQAVHGRPQGGQPTGLAAVFLSRTGVRVHAGNLSTPQPNATTRRKLWTTSCQWPLASGL
jgi:hypothetical protein